VSGQSSSGDDTVPGVAAVLEAEWDAEAATVHQITSAAAEMNLGLTLD